LPSGARPPDDGDMNEKSRVVLVAYDGSPDAETALHWAAATAAREGRPLRALMVVDADAIPLAAVPVVTKHWHELRDRAEVTLKEVDLDDASVEVIGGGAVVPLLLEAAEDAAMIVVGSRGHGHAAGVLTGSVSSHVSRHAPCPVVVVRAAEDPDSTKIVVGIDGSPDSRAALEFACQRAEISGEVVVALHAWRVATILPVDEHGDVPSSIAEKIDDKELLLAESVAGVRAAHPDVVVIQETIPVRPGDALVDASTTASLVVTGSRGRGHFLGLLLGSVSHEVLHRAHCPVAIVR
jgi:nucleotide-binding universal stress UspA family protein